MGTGVYVGRVGGGLAVALGIGAAMATGQGVASAAPASSSGSDGESSAQAGPAKQGASGSESPTSSHTKGPLAKLADRIRASAPAPRSTRPRGVPDRATTAGANAGDDVESASPGTTVLDGKAEPKPATTTKPKPRLFDTLRSRVGDIATQEPIANGTPKAEAITVQPEPVSTLPALRPPDLLNSVVVKVEQMVAQADPVPAATRALPAAAAATTAEPAVPGSASGIQAATGPAPLAGSSPTAPPQAPALLTVLAWARREFERTVNPTDTAAPAASTTPVAAVLVDPAAAAVVAPTQSTPKPAAPVVGGTEKLGWVTGPGITDAPSGTPGGYGIAGTDLGIMWDDGAGHVLMLFGDTFDQPNQQGVWRSNVLLRSVDHYLANGLQIQDAVISPGGDYNLNRWDNSFGATQVIRDPGFLGLFGSTTTIIPTAAISVTDTSGNTTQYANVMSVRTWDSPGRWTTNWSAIAYSTDGGLTWTVDPNTVRSSGWLRSSTQYVPGNQNFQQGAFVKGPEGDPYVYSFGTPSGRGGSAYVSRVPQDQIRNLGAYEYWAGDDLGWVRDDPSAAIPVIGATDQAPPPSGFIGWITKAINDFLGGIVVGGLTGGNVGELSVQYNPYLNEYVALRTDANNNVVMQVSDSPQGVWSDPTTLVANDLSTNTGMYAPMIHPWSGSDELGAANEQNLYWNLSYWGPYNVQLMQTDLSAMGPAGIVAV